MIRHPENLKIFGFTAFAGLSLRKLGFYVSPPMHTCSELVRFGAIELQIVMSTSLIIRRAHVSNT